MGEHDHIAVMADLSLAAAAARRGGRSSGRYARTPKFEAPSARSTRPNTGSGVTFHFAHKALSKRNDVSDGVGTATSASAHQGYIERREAGAEVTESGAKVLERWGEDYTHRSQPESDESPAVEQGYQRPDFQWSKDRTGFGTLGDSPAERKEFWKKVEHCERRNGRVQSRIIAELPHEATPEERIQIATLFCQKLEELGLPYWASIHAPTRKNDARNFHLHIAYSERPALKHPEHGWDFEAVVRKKKANRTTTTSRPLRQNRSPATRERGWVKKLRQHYADVSNTVLEKGGYEKRLDPRSYQESGVAKDPTRHLGFKAHAMESFGLDTEVGGQNAQKERRWRVQERTRRWERAMAVDDVAALFGAGLDDAPVAPPDDKRRAQIQTGMDMARLSAESELMAEQMGMRLGKRQNFLAQEGARLLARGRGLRISSAAQDIASIDAEKAILDTRSGEVHTMVVDLERQARTARKREIQIWDETFGGQSQTAGSSFFSPAEQTADAFWELPATKPVAPPVQEPKHPEKPSQSAAQKPTDEPRKDQGDPKNLDQEKGATPPQEKEVASGPLDAPHQKDGLAHTTTVSFGLDPQRDQGLLLIGRITQSADVTGLDGALRAMTNKETRMRAIATRDLVDVIEAGDLRERANRGWVVLKAEADRRGLNLETGRHQPEKGTDRERAALHRDEYLASVLQVRQELVEVQAR